MPRGTCVTWSDGNRPDEEEARRDLTEEGGHFTPSKARGDVADSPRHFGRVAVPRTAAVGASSVVARRPGQKSFRRFSFLLLWCWASSPARPECSVNPQLQPASCTRTAGRGAAAPSRFFPVAETPSLGKPSTWLEWAKRLAEGRASQAGLVVLPAPPWRSGSCPCPCPRPRSLCAAVVWHSRYVFPLALGFLACLGLGST